MVCSDSDLIAREIRDDILFGYVGTSKQAGKYWYYYSLPYLGNPFQGELRDIPEGHPHFPYGITVLPDV